jgi:hypothetical protein
MLSLEEGDRMSEEIKIVKSALPDGTERLPSSGQVGLMTVSIMLPSGIMITNPEQFEDNETEDIEAYFEDYEDA